MPATYPEEFHVAFRGDIAHQLRAVHARFAPASLGRLTLRELVLRAVDVGLDVVVAQLMAGAEHALAKPAPAIEEPTP